jgi:hypothetical protein
LLSTGQGGDVLGALKSTASHDLKKPFLAASSCGGTSWDAYPNNIYGWGLPDVCAGAAALGASCSSKS